jgi:hypothetical protein
LVRQARGGGHSRLTATENSEIELGRGRSAGHGADRHRRLSRVFSKGLFKAEIGDMLRSVGITPDAPGNIAQTADTFAEMDARFRDKLERFVDRANRALSNGLIIKPLLLMPETVWQSEYRNFLCATCRFYPADPSNVFFLAGTLRTAEILSLPLQANIPVQEAHDFAVQIIGVFGDMYEREKAAANNEREAVHVAYQGARSLSTIMTVKLFDPPQYEPEHKLFGLPMDRDFNKLF